MNIFIISVLIFLGLNINGFVRGIEICYDRTCCHNANKPLNYSDVEIFYSANFTSDTIVLTLWIQSIKEDDKILHYVPIETSGKIYNYHFQNRANFMYCFIRINNSSNLSLNKSFPFSYSLNYGFDEGKKIQIIKISKSETTKIDENKQKENVKKPNNYWDTFATLWANAWRSRRF